MVPSKLRSGELTEKMIYRAINPATGRYSGERARKRFFKEYFKLNRWIRKQSLATLQRLAQEFLRTYVQHRHFDTIFAGIEWWSDDLSLHTCKRIIKLVLHRKSEYALRNLLAMWSTYSLEDMVRRMKHRRADDDVMRAAREAAQREARLTQRRSTRGEASKNRKQLSEKEEEKLDHVCLQDELGSNPDFQRCSRHLRCVRKSHAHNVPCKLLEVGDHICMVFFGPPRTDTYGFYRGKVLKLLYSGKRVKVKFADETCTVSLNSWWHLDE